MQGQGAIIGVGALEYPAEWQGASNETLARNAVSPRSSRSRQHLRPPDHPGRHSPASSSGRCTQLLLGENGFYDEIFESLRIPYEPVRWVQDVSATTTTTSTRSPGSRRSSTPTACAGT
jgi:2-oxoglutarate decarboxylase